MLRSLTPVHIGTSAIVSLVLAAFLVMTAVALLDERPGLIHAPAIDHPGPAPCAAASGVSAQGSALQAQPAADAAQAGSPGGLSNTCLTPSVPAGGGVPAP